MLDEPHEGSGEVLAEILSWERGDDSERDEEPICPRCNIDLYLQRYEGIEEDINIDECLTCYGIWLDAGELNAIRLSRYTDEQIQQTLRRIPDANKRQNNRRLTEFIQRISKHPK